MGVKKATGDKKLEVKSKKDNTMIHWSIIVEK